MRNHRGLPSLELRDLLGLGEEVVAFCHALVTLSPILGHQLLILPRWLVCWLQRVKQVLLITWLFTHLVFCINTRMAGLPCCSIA